MIQPDLFSSTFVTNGDDNSTAAALQQYGLSTAQQLQVFECIASYTNGRTDKELQENTGLKGDTERPRRRELEKRDLIVRSGESRNGSAVWILSAKGLEVYRGEVRAA